MSTPLEPDPIETVLRAAPSPTAPKTLAATLRAGVPLSPVSRARPVFPSLLGKWWPILIPGGASAVLAGVVLFQELEWWASRSTAEQNFQTSISSSSHDAFPSASSTTEDVSARDLRADIENLRRRVQTLKEQLTAGDALARENIRLEAEIATIIAALPDDIQAALEAKRRASSIRCVYQLKNLGMATRIYAVDHAGEFPPDIKSMLDEIGDPHDLICPEDTARRLVPLEELKSFSVDEVSAHFSYEFLAPGPGSFESDPLRVLFKCPFHGHVALCDGSVQQIRAGEAASQLNYRDGKLYFGFATIATNTAPAKPQ